MRSDLQQTGAGTWRRMPANRGHASAAAGALLLTMLPAYAQQEEGGGSSGLALDEIIVTSQRRAENLQTVPISVQAFSSEELDRSVIENSYDLQQRVPGLVITSVATLGQPYLRGIGTDIVNVGSDPSVAMFIDGVYLARSVSSIQDFNDIERIEILKGPQGTLYGRNAAGGAISIVTADPSHSLESSFDLLYGNYDKVRARAMGNLPLGERAALRTSVLYSYREGFTRVLPFDRKIDDEDYWSVRTKLLLEPTDAVSFVLSGEYYEERSSRNSAPKLNGDTFSPARDLFGAQIPSDPRVITANRVNRGAVDQARVAGTLQWQLGSVVLKSISAYTETENRLDLEVDGTDIDFIYDTFDETSQTFTQELQLASSGDRRLEWVLGLYYLNEEADQRLPIGIVPFGALIDYDTANETDAYAVFGQATYRLLDKLRLTTGARYSREEKSARFDHTITDPFGILTGFPPGIHILTLPEGEWSAWTPKFGLDYFVTDDAMLYVSATRGFKSGGFNLQGSGEVFDPEYLWNYEGGLKATWLEGRLRTNLAAFFYDYQDLQVNTYTGVATLITNAAEARVRGLEAEIDLLLAKGLRLDLTAALLSAEYEDYVTSNPDAADQTALVNLAGNRLPRAPKEAASAGIEYTLPDFPHGELMLRGELKYQSHIFFSPYNTPIVEQPGYALFNARVGYVSPSGRWEVSLFGRNLGDKLYRQSQTHDRALFGTLDSWGPPRTYGIQFGMNR